MFNLTALTQKFDNGFFDTIMDCNPFRNKETQMDDQQDAPATRKAKTILGVATLPEVGNEDVLYKELDTSEIFIYENDEWRTYNPYTHQRGQRKLLLIDDLSLMPSISEDQLRKGASVSLAVVYAVRALQADLHLIKTHKIYVSDLLINRPFSGVTAEQRLTKWFMQDHTLLVRLLRTVVLDPKYYNEVRDSLDSINVVFQMDKQGKLILKTGDFSVTF